MMELMVRLTAVGATAAVLCAVLRKNTPELSLLLALAAGIWMLFLTADTLSQGLEVLRELTALTEAEDELLRPVVKVVALSLLTRITAEICRSAGEGGIAAFVETGGTVLALGVALPLIRAVIVLMGEMLG